MANSGGELLKRIVVIVIVAALVLAGGLCSWALYLRDTARERFGSAPLLGFEYDEEASLATSSTCERVASISPPYHWNLLGQMWQEDSIHWEDVQTLSPAPQEFEHGRTGVMKIGDVVCGWATTGWGASVYRPTGSVLSCRSYEDNPRPYHEPCERRKWPW